MRSYPAKLLSPADRALAEQLEQRRRAALSPKLQTEYPLVMKGYTKDTADVAVSPHFAFYTGADKAGSGKKAFAPGFLDRQKAWFETVWTHLDGLGAPMPMAKDPSPHKLNVFVTGTGLAKHKEGFAFGGEDVIMHPGALGDGSSVVIHEFTHSVQFYSKGFRDSPLVGAVWTGAGLQPGTNVTEAYANILGNIGVRVQSAKSAAALSAGVAAEAELARSAKSGVNLDEEAARLIQYQQTYQAAAKMLQVAQTVFDTLLQTAGR